MTCCGGRTRWQFEMPATHTLATSARSMAGSVPEKSVGEPTNSLPFSVISVVIFACGLNGHLATPLSNSVSFKLSICKLSAIANGNIYIDAIRMFVFLFERQQQEVTLAAINTRT